MNNMEEETAATTFWCHTCSQTVTPVDIKCPFCLSGFLDEMQQEEEEQQRDSNVWRPDIPVWASLLVEMTNNSERNQTVETENETEHRGGGGGDYMESRLQEMLRRRGRRPVCVEQLLLGIRAGLTLAPAAADDNNQERGRVIVTNPHNQIVAVPSSAVSDTLPPVVAGSLSEYFIGPKFEALLETLTETDPRRYGTPPAWSDAVEALASVIIVEPGLQCSVCLDDFEVLAVGKQMSCHHSFHPHCLLPWLELHSSCPVCRCQLPIVDGETNGGSSSTSSSSQVS
ncbi:E3 ubiquitin-protein ligase SIRP1-like [Brassica napus]|nr:E3 ubiquitin-protein ligase SIRP1-like [Brassica napus]